MLVLGWSVDQAIVFEQNGKVIARIEPNRNNPREVAIEARKDIKVRRESSQLPRPN